MENVPAYIGMVTGIISILALAYTLAFRFGKLETKVDLLWNIDIVDALRRQRKEGRIVSESADKISVDWLASFTSDAEIVATLEEIAAQKKVPGSDAELAVLCIQEIGYQKCVERSAELNLGMGDYISILVTRIRQERAAKS